jgi:lipopolysaccharide transport system permease protein
MPKLIIEAGRTSKHYWKDLWRYRELFYFLAWRDLLVRYRQTAIGLTWAVLRPLLTMLVLTVIFGHVAHLTLPGVPQPILVLAGMLPWQFFSNSLADSSNSLVANANLISKIYFPRLLVPASSVVVSLVDFLISFVILIYLLLWYQFPLTWHFIALPPLVLLAFLASLGPSLLITALNVRYRDFRYIIPFVVQFGLYVSPVGFSSSRITQALASHGLSEQWRLVYSLNPIVGVIDGFRWAICGHEPFYWPGFMVSLAVIGLMLAFGLRYFRRTERAFADII